MKVLIARLILGGVFAVGIAAIINLPGAHQQRMKQAGMMQTDCDKVKESCTRKSGCKCERKCNENGDREPAQGGKAECPSYCCENRCKCHPACP
jgi:hypothetical protein